MLGQGNVGVQLLRPSHTDGEQEYVSYGDGLHLQNGWSFQTEIAKIIAQVTEHYQCLTTRKRTRESFLSSDNLILFLISMKPIRNKITL